VGTASVTPVGSSRAPASWWRRSVNPRGGRQPELHLRPHVEAWCQRLALIDEYTDDAGAYFLDLEWRDALRSVGETRPAVFHLIGSFAESATYVRQRRASGDGDGPTTQLQFEVGTGELAPDARCAPHGHAVVINVAGVP